MVKILQLNQAITSSSIRQQVFGTWTANESSTRVPALKSSNCMTTLQQLQTGHHPASPNSKCWYKGCWYKDCTDKLQFAPAHSESKAGHKSPVAGPIPSKTCQHKKESKLLQQAGLQTVIS